VAPRLQTNRLLPLKRPVTGPPTSARQTVPTPNPPNQATLFSHFASLS